MAYILSSGVWDVFGPITLDKVLGHDDPVLASALQQWQAEYDDQFKTCPYEFDWQRFNATGVGLTSRIRDQLPVDAEIHYEPSDDREFFKPGDCCAVGSAGNTHVREQDLRARKRALLYSGIACDFQG